jgi:hypothetical protein
MVPETSMTEAQKQKAADEARLAAQVQFDPKLHGVGTQPVDEPQHTSGLFKWAMGAFRDVENKLTSFHKRLSALENKPAPVAKAPASEEPPKVQ